MHCCRIQKSRQVLGARLFDGGLAGLNGVHQGNRRPRRASSKGTGLAKLAFQVTGLEVVANGDVLVEGLVGSKAEIVGQIRLTEKHQGDVGIGIHFLAEQEAQLVKEFRR